MNVIFGTPVRDRLPAAPAIAYALGPSIKPVLLRYLAGIQLQILLLEFFELA